MITISDIAKEANVSVDTVSRVLNGGIKGRRRDAVERAENIKRIAERLNYRPNASARAMRSARTRNIGVLLRNDHLPDTRFINPSAFETVLGMHEGLRRTDHALTVINVAELAASLGSQSHLFRERVLDGILVLGNSSPMMLKEVDEVTDHIVYCDTDTWEDSLCIRRDELKAGALAGEWSLRQKSRSVVWAGEQPKGKDHYSLSQRLEGLRQVLQSADIDLIFPFENVPWNDSDPEAQSRKLVDCLNPEVCVVAYDTPMAEWVLHTALAAGKVEGRDYRLACCDDHDLIGRTWPHLPRASFDRYSMGLQAAEMMLVHLESSSGDPDSKLISPTWIETVDIDGIASASNPCL